MTINFNKVFNYFMRIETLHGVTLLSGAPSAGKCQN